MGSKSDLDGRNAFLHACFSRNIETVKYLANKYPRLINSVDGNNNNGLLTAAWICKTDIIVYLIEDLAMDPTVKSRYGKNTFLRACYSGNIETVKYLAEKYPRLIKSYDRNNNNGLELAARAGKMEIVVFLIEGLGMDPFDRNKYGQNAIWCACQSGNIETVEYLANKYPTLKTLWCY